MGVSVVDASALAALLFGEPRGEEVAVRLREEHLVAPSLLRYELASTCVKKLALHPDRREELLLALGLVEEMDLDEVGVPLVEKATTADETGLTAYDAAYLWLARTLGASLVTFDDELERVFEGGAGGAGSSSSRA